MSLPLYEALRYVQPLREGGSLPAVVDTSAGLFVVKFRGAGQGPKALIAEIVVGQLAQRLGLPVPELALVEVAPEFGRAEPDPEIQEILRASHGLNFGMRYLDGAFNFDGMAAAAYVDARFAAEVVWFDAFVTNPDRTHRNPNLLIWQRRPWLIDHGAALYAHHAWSTVDAERTRSPFPLSKQHVLLAQAEDIAAADTRLAGLLTEDLFDDVLAAIPDALLRDPLIAAEFESAAAARARYQVYFAERLKHRASFVQHALQARAQVLAEPARRRHARR